jgi:hypothetical protein
LLQMPRLERSRQDRNFLRERAPCPERVTPAAR